MTKTCIWIVIAITLASLPASAQLLTTNVGPGSFGGTTLPSCGAGVIDLSTGCTQPMLGGL